MSKAALSRAIKRGAISAEKQLDGSFKIDPAELHRVYPAVTEQLARTTADTTELQTQNIELQAKLEAATQRLHDKDGVIDDLRRRLDTEGEERRRLMAVLTDQRQTRPKGRWWMLPAVATVAVLALVMLAALGFIPVRSSLP